MIVRFGNKSAPPIAFGCAYLGTKLGVRESFAVLDEFRERGGRILDTANSYAAWLPGASGGESERMIGRWIGERRAGADMIVVTKAGFAYGDVPEGCAGALLESECEKSLARLGLDSVDAFLAHRMDPSISDDEIAESLSRLARRGMTCGVGASNYERDRWVSLSRSLDRSAGTPESGRPDLTRVLQNFFPAPAFGLSPPTRRAVGTPRERRQCAEFGWTFPDLATLKTAEAAGGVAMAHTALLWGLAVSDGPLPPFLSAPEIRRERDRIRSLAEETGEPAVAVALASYFKDRSHPVIPVFSASVPAHVASAMRSLELA